MKKLQKPTTQKQHANQKAKKIYKNKSKRVADKEYRNQLREYFY